MKNRELPRGRTRALVVAGLLSFALPVWSQDYTLEGGVSVALDTRFGGQALGDLGVAGNEVVDGRVISVYGRGGPNPAGTPGSFYLVASRPSDGAVEWMVVHRTDPDLEDNPFRVVAAPNGSALFVLVALSDPAPGGSPDRGHALLRFEAADGAATLLVFDPPGASTQDTWRDLYVAPDGDTLFVRANLAPGFELVAYDSASGDELWRHVEPEFQSWTVQTFVSRETVAFTTTAQSFFPLPSMTELVVLDAATGAELWTEEFDGLLPDQLMGSHDGETLALLGVLPSFVSNPPPALHVFDGLTGTPRWTSPDVADRLVVSPDGSALFEASQDSSGSLIEVRERDAATGDVAWESMFGAGSAPRANRMLYDPVFDRLVVEVELDSTTLGAVDSLLVGFDAGPGGLEWLRQDTKTRLGSLRFAPSGDRLFAAFSEPVPLPDGTSPRSVKQRAMSASLGQQEWENVFSDSGATTDEARAMDVSPDGRRAVLGGLSTKLSTVRSLAALDTDTGDRVWELELPVTETVHSMDVVVSPNSARVYERVHVGDGEVLSARRMSDGSLIWSLPLLDSDAKTPGAPSSFLRPGPGGQRLYVARRSLAPPSPDNTELIVTAVDAKLGKVLWERYLDTGPRADEPRDVVVSPDGATVVVSGTAGQDSRTLIAAFEAATGNSLWTNIGPVRYRSASIARFSRDGASLFVVTTRDSGGAYGVVAYDAATGAPVWNTSIQNDTDVFDADVSLDGARLLLVGQRRLVSPGTIRYELLTTSIDTASGATQWEFARSQSLRTRGISIDVGADGNTVYTTSALGFFSSSSNPSLANPLVFAHDLESGELLWQASAPLTSSRQLVPCDVRLEPSRQLLYLAGDDPNEDFGLLALSLPDLIVDRESVPLAQGGTVELALRPGLGREADPYYLLGSATGTSPGIDFGGGLVLPLEPDAYFFVTLAAKASALSGFQGSFDARGIAAASLTIPAGSDPALAGTTLHHAFLAADVLGFPDGVSNVVEVLLTP